MRSDPITQISQINFVTLAPTIILTPYSLIAVTDDSSDAACDTIAQINHINWVVNHCHPTAIG